MMRVDETLLILTRVCVCSYVGFTQSKQTNNLNIDVTQPGGQRSAHNAALTLH